MINNQLVYNPYVYYRPQLVELAPQLITGSHPPRPIKVCHLGQAAVAAAQGPPRAHPVEGPISIIEFVETISGWWFGTCFFHILGIIIPID